MSIRVSKLAERILRYLDDVERSDASTWPSEDVVDYLNSALRTISDHTAQEKIESQLLAQDAESIALPDDPLQLGPVWLTNGDQRQLVEPLVLMPGQGLPPLATSTSLSGMLYYRWPSDTLRFTAKIPSGTTYTIYYYGYWEQVESLEQELVLPAPAWMENALFWYCIAEALGKKGVQASELAQYKTKLDSGNPEHNPLLQHAAYALKRYDREMANHPQQDRSLWGAQ